MPPTRLVLFRPTLADGGADRVTLTLLELSARSAVRRPGFEWCSRLDLPVKPALYPLADTVTVSDGVPDDLRDISLCAAAPKFGARYPEPPRGAKIAQLS